MITPVLMARKARSPSARANAGRLLRMGIASTDTSRHMTSFARRVGFADPEAKRAATVDTLMVNVGLRCDLACAHCHQSSSPTRPEVMSHEAMQSVLRLIALLRPSLVDITGGEPTLWEHLTGFIESLRVMQVPVRVRTNVVALARPELAHLPAFFAQSGVQLVASLPGVTAGEVAALRGSTFDASMAVLRTLAGVGYGSGDPDLVLDLAYNPPLGELPRPGAALAEEFRAALSPLGVRFNTVRVIANVPAGRYARQLKESGAYDAQLVRLADAFNPAVLGDLGCRHGIEVAWDGSLADCDFNLGAGIRVADGPRTVSEALALDAGGADVLERLSTRRIAFAPHCYACAAGVGSG